MGEQLIEMLCSETQLPKQLIRDELLLLIEKAGLDSQTITLDELRTILTRYLQDILVAAKRSH